MPRELDALGDAPPSQTTPVLLELARKQAARRRPADLLAQWVRDAYVAPSMLDGRTMHALDGLALEAAEGFEALVLSPVAPLGSCSVVAPTSQDRTLSANRGTEVVADPTNVLALECAHRLREDPTAVVRLCTLHQVMRCQPLPPFRGASRHFRMFAMVQAGPARAEDGFEIEAFGEQIAVMQRLCDRAEALGHRLVDRALTLRAAPGHEVLAGRLETALRSTGLAVERAEPPHAYYDGVRLSFDVRAPDGAVVPIGDVGRFDWVAQLTSNRRMRMIATGFGLQLLPLRFAHDGAR
ncbi:hypothetical protein [Paraliomyxa miuraensis]|uniref:hypothetical protein n=1 Tax=Paraliomyxa miuraensis TaxID=376150 RepID=UPI00224DCF4E|nr:hypothetical protein [Paraliomyxa miuraensis]MCX4239914.1 hypothetical protein [Paraliomyxa miuraensis]